MVIYMRYRCLFEYQIILLYAVAYATQTDVGGYRYGGWGWVKMIIWIKVEN